MSFTTDMLMSPEYDADAAVIAREARDELFSRLDWMTIKPAVILDMSHDAQEMSGKWRERYPDAKVTVGAAEGGHLPLRDQSVDLIFANFCLPWHRDAENLLREWRRVLAPEGLLMLTALGLDTLREWREALRLMDVPRCVDMHDVGDDLLRAGFDDPVLDVNHYHVNYRELPRLLQDLRLSGMWFPAPDSVLDESALPLAQDGVWQLTYEVVFAHAFGRVPGNAFSPDEDGVVRIPLNHLRRR